jgi:hypothetical protein
MRGAYTEEIAMPAKHDDPREALSLADAAESKHLLDRLADRVDGGNVSRSTVLKTIAAALLGGLSSVFARANDGEAATTLETLWAVVNANGTLNRGEGVVASTKLDTGEYRVRFERNVSQCAYTATLDHTSGFVFIGLRFPDDSPRTVRVVTTDRGGTVRDSQFHLVVNC